MLRTIDLVLRFAYVAAVPALLPAINEIMPIAALLIGTAVATVIALVGSEVWRSNVERIPYAGRVLGNMGNLGEFYARFPAKPLVYYIVYPLLLPVILFMRVPRREFFLYRKMNAITMIVIAITGAYDYFEHWRPELSLAQFAGATIGVFVMQLVITFMFVMPIVTTLIELRQSRKIKVLWLLAVLMLGSAIYGGLMARHQRTMSIMTWFRLEQRTKYARAELKECEKEHPDQVRTCVRHDPQLRALADALEVVVKGTFPDDDAALAAVREKLGEYYKPDEANAFRVREIDDVLLIYARYARKKAIWLGLAKGHFLTKPEQLPTDRLRKFLGY
jgi:hypothetical protein